MINKFCLYLAATGLLTYQRYLLCSKKLDHFSDLWKIYSVGKLYALGFSEKSAEIFIAKKRSMDLNYIENEFLKSKTSLVSIEDANYPRLLKQISDPPVFLFVKGRIYPEEDCLSVVGSRKLSSYSIQVAKKIIPDLCRYFCIVSGLAYGADSLAHKLALENKTRTIAVIASGHNHIYPASNTNLSNEIIKRGGAILSEYFPDTLPASYRFPVRNRIVSGLSRGTLILAAALKSGSLITARLALEQNREVFAVPGDIFNPANSGANVIIQRGEAKLVYQAIHLLEEFGITSESEKNIQKNIQQSTLSDLESKILDLVDQGFSEPDSIAENLGIGIKKITSCIIDLELKSLVFLSSSGQILKK